MSLQPQADRLSDLLHRHAAQAAEGVLWLALEGATPQQQERSELRQALLPLQPLVVPLPHPQIDERLRPVWYRLDTHTASDSALVRLSVETALEELAPSALRAGEGREVAGWITLPSALAPADAAAQVGARMIQRHNGRDLLLRLHDPAVLWWLWRFLELPQRSALLHPVLCWQLLDPAGVLVALEGSPLASPRAMGLTESQWDDVHAIGALNRVLRERGVLIGEPQHDEPVFRAMVSAVRRARRHGFSEPADLALFAHHALDIHPRFDTHPLVLGLLQARSADDGYAALAAELEQAQWQQVQRECKALNEDAS